MTSSRLKIGLSACHWHPDPSRKLFLGKPLLYVEQSLAHWIMATGALVVMVPDVAGPTARGDASFDDYADWLDGLVLHGGADVWPGSYGESPIDDRWSGDRVRDIYELALVRAFERRGKPLFGVCRGLQLLNVAFGGSLYQDIPTQVPGARQHRDGDIYDLNFHEVDLREGTRLASLYPGVVRARVNSIHHQAIKTLAPGFDAEAHSVDDGIVEAIRRREGPYVAAVQWHPEFHRPAEQATLNDDALLADFLEAVRAARTS